MTVLLVQACLEVNVRYVLIILSSDDTYLGMCLYTYLYIHTYIYYVFLLVCSFVIVEAHGFTQCSCFIAINKEAA